ncbi:glycosyltransferase family 2 protein [Algirhabdus cladophorae]|uniref:glycosyltransferase family 2 protein n=1 Tax=Algirhabdus cladophorae TaxID=3377108 RepID=UPI003B8465EC
MQNSAEVSVIIINYGTADLTIKAVNSVLERDHGGRHVDVHLVDNASPGDDAHQLAEAAKSPLWTKHVTTYLETTNHGFGRGNNLVIERLAAQTAPPQKIMLLNPDATLDNDAIDVLAKAMDENPQIGFAGAAIAKPDTGPVTAAFRFPSITSELIRTLGLNVIAKQFEHTAVALPPNLGTQQVDWVSGAAVMMRMEAIQSVGFFDPAYFLYYEEVDLMRRAGQNGWQSWHIAEAKVLHAEGAATGVGQSERKRRPDYWYQSWAHYFFKSYGPARAALLSVSMLGAAGLQSLKSILSGRPSKLPKSFGSDFTRTAVRPLLTGRSPLS